MNKYQIGIIGSAGPEEYPKNGKPSKSIFKIAEKLGELIAKNNAVLVTGGKGGIMESASKGAKRYKGITVGIVKGDKRGTSNEFIDIEIVTNTMGASEEAILVNSCDGIIAVGGGAGTLQELTAAYRKSKPVVIINNIDGISSQYANKYMDNRKNIKFLSASSPKNAVDSLFRNLNE